MIREVQLDYEKYRERYELLYPDYTDEERREMFALRVDFWQGIIERL